MTGYTTHFKDVTYVKNLEARLKISERNYIVLFDTILSSIVIVDPFGKILNCNYFAERLYGYTGRRSSAGTSTRSSACTSRAPRSSTW